MANPENLRPWPPGRSGNPGGRPRFAEVSQTLRRLLTEPPAALGRKPKTIAEQLAIALLRKAVRGGIRAAAEAMDRTEGRVPQAHEIGGTDGGRLIDEGQIANRITELMAKAKATGRKGK